MAFTIEYCSGHSCMEVPNRQHNALWVILNQKVAEQERLLGLKKPLVCCNLKNILKKMKFSYFLKLLFQNYTQIVWLAKSY